MFRTGFHGKFGCRIGQLQLSLDNHFWDGFFCFSNSFSTFTFLYPKLNHMHPDNRIGEKIGTLRNLKKLELTDLANRSGLSVNQLELIETGRSIPSLGVLIRISRALGIRIGTLLDDTVKEGPAVMREKDRQQAYSFSTSENENREHLTFFSLAPNKAGRHMEPFIVDIVPGENKLLPKSSHEGEEFIYVMDGKITVAYGTDVIQLEKGDSIYLDSIVDHLVTTPGPSARILGVVYVPV
jgi:transcriptional regulator with XRE-family HTH domain